MTTEVRIPDLLAHTASAWFGDEGRLWLERLPEMIAECAARWTINVGAPYEPGGAVSWVAPVHGRGATKWVLKIAIPNDESRYEHAALRQLHGDGMVRLIDTYRERGALLLERLEPGTPLTAMEDEDEANRIAAGLLGRLLRPPLPGHRFSRAADEALRWGRDLHAENEAAGRPCDRALVEEAVELAYHLAGSEGKIVLASRDFHQGNILAAQREPWLAIDPKPVVAEREYACGALLRDRRAELAGDPAAAPRMTRRLDLLSDELGLDRDRMRAWGLLQAVALGLWSHSVGDRIEGDRLLGCARLLREA
jgi:streptomycin 6-kinase